MSTSASRGHLRLRKPVALVLGAVISLAGVTAIAVQDQAGAVATQAECDAFKAATEAAMANQLMIVNSFMGSATSSMQAAVSKQNSCIGNLAMLDFDMSKLIPDFGLLGSLLSGALSKIVDGVINRACAALTSVMNTPSEIWNSIVGGFNVNDQFQTWSNGINYSLPGGAGSSGGGNWGAAQPAAANPWTTPSTQTPTSPGSLCTYGPSGMVCTVPELQPPPSPSGADIGANYQYLLIACTGALQQDAAAGTGVSPGSAAACAQVQGYINTYAPYLDRSTVPTLPGYPLTIPDGMGSAVGGAPETPIVFSPPNTVFPTGGGGATFGGGTGTVATPTRPANPATPAAPAPDPNAPIAFSPPNTVFPTGGHGGATSGGNTGSSAPPSTGPFYYFNLPIRK